MIKPDKVRCRCGRYIDPTKNMSVGGETVCTNATCRASALTDALGAEGAADYEETRKRLLSAIPNLPP